MRLVQFEGEEIVNLRERRVEVSPVQAAGPVDTVSGVEERPQQISPVVSRGCSLAAKCLTVSKIRTAS